MATANPAFNEAVFRRSAHAGTAGQVMTVEGSAIKTGILVVILLATAMFTWVQGTGINVGPNGQVQIPPQIFGLLALGGIGGLITAFITIFSPRVSPVTAPIYAALEGLALGGISVLIDIRYPGIAIQAVGVSVGTLICLLVLYSARMIRNSPKFTLGVVAATGGICVVYVIDMLMSFFGSRIPFIHESGLLGIGFSLFVVVIAAMNLILDFDFIEQGAARRAPKYMEWYGAFGLMVTLVWLYIEVLRLLAKLRGRD
jgi:uncharacterized YccA/Bax inhibitor family protein